MIDFCKYAIIVHITLTLGHKIVYQVEDRTSEIYVPVVTQGRLSFFESSF